MSVDMSKDVFTTGQAAEICKVSQQIIIDCFDSGRLKGFCVPGSRHRRIPREFLIEFGKNKGLPLNGLEDADKTRVLIVSQDQRLIKVLRQVLPLERLFRVLATPDSFDAGIEAKAFYPTFVIVDFAIGQKEGERLCQSLRANSEFAKVLLIALIPRHVSLLSFKRSSINETLDRTFDLTFLMEELRTLIEGKRKQV